MFKAMDLLPFGKLSEYRPRRFIPAHANLGNWDDIEPLFNELERRAEACQSAKDLEQWLLAWSEMNAAIDEESSRRYIAMTCHTDNAEAKTAYLHFVEHMEPHSNPASSSSRKSTWRIPSSATAATSLPCIRPGLKVHVELFRPENVPLETEEAKLGQQYQELSGT